MKKLLSLTLILVLLLGMIVACDVKNNDGNTDTSSEESDKLSSDTNSEEISNTDTSSEESDKLSSDTNSEEISNTDSDKTVEPEKQIHTSTWKFNYDYGFHQEGTVTLLVDFSKLGSGFENLVIPDSIVAGDTITIEYTGKWVTEESYPGRTSLYGELISYSFSYANVICLMGEQATTENLKAKYDFKHEYVILNGEGEYVLFDEYEGNEIYLVLEQQSEETEGYDLPLKVACALAYNPRRVEGGERSYITKEQALEIAENDFYSKYAKDFCHYETKVEISITDYLYYIVRFKEFPNDGGEHEQIEYYYTVDGFTEKILKIEMAE